MSSNICAVEASSSQQLLSVGISASFSRNYPGLLQPVVDRMLASYPFIRCEHFDDATVTPDAIRRFDATIADEPTIGAKAFDGGVNTALVARWGVGYNTIDVEACTQADVALAITRDAVRRPMAEAIVTFLLALAKKLPEKDALVRSGRWEQLANSIGLGLAGKTVGSVGLGNIGSEMFRLLGPFGFERRIAHDPFASQQLAGDVGLNLVDLDTVFRESDFVTVNCLLNSQTQGLIGSRLLKLMKPTAYFINTSRGGLVVEDDLVRVLQERRIAGAALDVFQKEPLPLDSPLIGMENVLMAPHGLGYTDDLVRDNSVSVCESVLAVLRGEAPRDVVNQAVLARPQFRRKLERLRQRWQTLCGT